MTTKLSKSNVIAVYGLIIGLVVSLGGNIIQFVIAKAQLKSIEQKWVIENPQNYIVIKDVHPFPQSDTHGSRLAIDYIISNTLGMPFSGWLGASMTDSCGKTRYNTS
ncbi:MAG TPA: hypothetical protein DCO75_12280, partial [Fibrobacteres bacterium]|nr:hypothetical protein [Fibrobacterota bacterium]